MPMASLDMILSKKANNKGADQSARMRRLVCAFVVHKPPKIGFLASRPIYSYIHVRECNRKLFFLFLNPNIHVCGGWVLKRTASMKKIMVMKILTILGSKILLI